MRAMVGRAAFLGRAALSRDSLARSNDPCPQVAWIHMRCSPPQGLDRPLITLVHRGRDRCAVGEHRVRVVGLAVGVGHADHSRRGDQASHRTATILFSERTPVGGSAPIGALRAAACVFAVKFCPAGLGPLVEASGDSPPTHHATSPRSACPSTCR